MMCDTLADDPTPFGGFAGNGNKATQLTRIAEALPVSSHLGFCIPDVDPVKNLGMSDGNDRYSLNRSRKHGTKHVVHDDLL